MASQAGARCLALAVLCLISAATAATAAPISARAASANPGLLTFEDARLSGRTPPEGVGPNGGRRPDHIMHLPDQLLPGYRNHSVTVVPQLGADGTTTMAAALATPTWSYDSPCVKGFTGKGSNPRRTAVMLYKWPRAFYGDSVTVGGQQVFRSQARWDNPPAPKEFATLFTNECDGRASVNRGMFESTFGAVTMTGVQNGSTLNEVDVFGWQTLYLEGGSPSTTYTDVLTRADGSKYCFDDGPYLPCRHAVDQWNAANPGKQLDITQYDHIYCHPLHCLDDASPGVCRFCEDGCSTCFWAWSDEGGAGACSPKWPRTWTFMSAGDPFTSAPDGGYKGTAAHELGHANGQVHAAATACAPLTSRKAAACNVDEYGDAFSAMGGSVTYSLPAYENLLEGQLPAKFVKSASPPSKCGPSSGTLIDLRKYNLKLTRGEALSSAAAPTPMVLKVPLPTPAAAFSGSTVKYAAYEMTYWNCRGSNGTSADPGDYCDPNQAQGVLVRLTTGTDVCERPLLMATDAATSDRWTWVLSTVNQSYTDGCRKMKFTLVSKSAEQVRVRVESICGKVTCV